MVKLAKFAPIIYAFFAFSGAPVDQAEAQTNDQLSFTCRYYGRDYKINEEICLPTPDGLRRATCGKVLNNSAWETSQQACTPASKKQPRTSSKAQSYIEDYVRESLKK